MPCVRVSALAFLVGLLATPASAGGTLKAGWTPEVLRSTIAECTEVLVQGTWENTKKDQGVDPKAELTAEIRKQLAPEIAKLEKLCTCAVREGAKRYTHAEAEAGPADLERAVSESMSNGRCKPAP
jgi:hypothetical protein